MPVGTEGLLSPRQSQGAVAVADEGARGSARGG